MADTRLNNGWEEHQRQQRIAWLRLTHAERLRWLEQAKDFGKRAKEEAEKRRLASSDGPGTDNRA